MSAYPTLRSFEHIGTHRGGAVIRNHWDDGSCSYTVEAGRLDALQLAFAYRGTVQEAYGGHPSSGGAINLPAPGQTAL